MIQIPLELLSLEDNSYHLLVEVVLNQNSVGKMVVDTGASRSVLDANLPIVMTRLEELPHSSGIGGEVTAFFAEISCFYIGEFSLENTSFAFIDLSAVNQAYQKATEQRIFGLLGSDLLLKYKAKIDYEKLVLFLAKN